MGKDKTEFYVQCLLKKTIPDGCRITTSWIPEKFAVKGKYVKLKGDDGWEVYRIFSKVDKKTIEENERNHTKHRKATDI